MFSSKLFLCSLSSALPSIPENGWCVSDVGRIGSDERVVDIDKRNSKTVEVSSNTVTPFIQELNEQYTGITFSLDSHVSVKMISYSQGGGFDKHTDDQRLTMIVSLKTADEGGETVFYGRGERKTWRQKVGQAIIFDGRIPHSASVVQSGEKVVLVCSLTAVKNESGRLPRNVVTLSQRKTGHLKS